MKKLFVMLAVVASLTSNAAFAQSSSSGRGAAAAKNNASDDFAWGIGLVGLGVLATVVGLTAATAAQSPSAHSH